MGRVRACLAALGLFAALPARAYIPTVTAAGGPVTWRGSVKLNLAGNPVNKSGVDPASFYAAVVRSLQRWHAASDGRVSFDYWQGTDPNIYIPSSEYDGLSSLHFASNSKGATRLSPNVLGLTQVWYDTVSGQILETDIVLNDENFHFTTRPQDTSGYGSGGPTGSAGGGLSSVFIENVITHELGHALGLSHSGGLQSTMLFMESPEQAHLGCDEEIAIRALYPSADAGARGGLSGTVISDAGKPIFGAHVVAISRSRGTVMATGLTNASGQYQISALEPGAYFLMVEPYFAGASSLPGYYSGMNDSLCSGSAFARGFLVDGTGYIPEAVHVAAGATAGTPTLVTHCDSRHGAQVRGAVGSASLSSAPTVFNGSANGFGVVDRFNATGSAYYRLQALGGHLEIHALSFSLYSPMRSSLALLDSQGSPVAGVQVSEPVYSGDSGYINYDSALTADGLGEGDYIVQVQSSALDATRYPAGSVALDATPFLLLMGSVNEGVPPLASVLPLNARCRMSENFPSYTSPPGNPPRNTTDAGIGSGFGFCGTIARDGGGSGGGDGPRPGAAAVVGWLLPWLAMLLSAQLAKVLARASRRSRAFL